MHLDTLSHCVAKTSLKAKRRDSQIAQRHQQQQKTTRLTPFATPYVFERFDTSNHIIFRVLLYLYLVKFYVINPNLVLIFIFLSFISYDRSVIIPNVSMLWFLFF